MQCPSIKFPPFWYDIMILFLIYIYIYNAFIIQKCKNTRFLNEISSKNFKSLNGHIFNSYISISYTIKNICPRISLTTLVLKYICNFFKLCDKYYFVTNILHTFKLLDWILSQSNIQNKKIKSKMWCPYITKKNNYKNIILVTTIIGGLNVLMPFDAKFPCIFCKLQ